MHIYEVRPRQDHRGFDLISDALPSTALVPKKQCNKLRGARIPGDLPWRGGHESARRSNNRLSAPVSARSLLP
jgi:hypothetical protein